MIHISLHCSVSNLVNASVNGHTAHTLCFEWDPFVIGLHAIEALLCLMQRLTSQSSICLLFGLLIFQWIPYLASFRGAFNWPVTLDSGPAIDGKFIVAAIDSGRIMIIAGAI